MFSQVEKKILVQSVYSDSIQNVIRYDETFNFETEQEVRNLP